MATVSVKRSIHDRKGPFMIDKYINKNHTNLVKAQQGWYNDHWEYLPPTNMARVKHGSYNCDSDKQISRTFQGFFKDKLQFSRTKDLFNKLEVFNLLLSTLLAKTLNGVIYDFYFFSHGWSHYFMLLSKTTLCKMTGYDSQLHLGYRTKGYLK